jgi:DNA-binding NtrC family response regulator
MSGWHQVSILYLDDEQTCLEVFRQTFGGDYEVRTAATAEEARRELASRSFDVVVSDQRMPDVSGAAFLREAAAAQPASYRIMLTGDASVGEMLRELCEGVIHCFVTKPWHAEVLRQAFERAFTDGRGRLMLVG